MVFTTRPPFSAMTPAVTDSKRSTRSARSFSLVVRLSEVNPTMSANPATMLSEAGSSADTGRMRAAAATRWRRHT